MNCVLCWYVLDRAVPARFIVAGSSVCENHVHELDPGGDITRAADRIAQARAT